VKRLRSKISRMLHIETELWRLMIM
jgi:hypothetical protein